MWVPGLMKSEKLKNKAVLVTGGAKRLGKEIAWLFASLGYDIALHYNSSKNEAIKTSIEIRDKYKVNCTIYIADLLKETELETLIDQVFDDFPSIEILINSASIFTRAKIKDTSFDIFKNNIDLNFKAPFFLTKLFCNKIIKNSNNNEGSNSNFNIINILDTKIDKKNQTVYSAYSLSKMALSEFTKLSAIEYAEYNIRVNGIAIGTILPPENNTDFNNPENLKNHNLLKKIGSIKNLTKTVSFVVDNDFITGEIIFVDGGEKLI